MNVANFVPLNFVDPSFDLDLKGEKLLASLYSKPQVSEDGREDPEETKVKLGKVMTNKHNIGIALVDYQKMDEIGGNRVYWIDDYRVVLWQPMWLDIINQRKLALNKEKDDASAEPMDAEEQMID